MSIDLNLEPLEATIGAGALIVNDYRITTEPIDGGHRITVTRGSEVQTMDLLDGAQGAPGETGPAGPQGEQGPQGPQGEPGQDAPQDVVRYAAQSLDAEQQAQARENIGAADAVTVNGLKDDLSGKVDFSEPQSLNAQQQTQAQSNIGIHKVTQAEYDALTDTSGIYIIVEE